MLLGKAPNGIDNKPVNLHHVVGKSVDMFNYVEMTRTDHYRRFKELHTLRKKFKFLLEACPDYLFSIDIEESGILENLMEEFPESMPKSKRIKEFRSKLRSMFYVEGQKYPHWIQESEWPMSKTGKPTKYLRQKSKGEVTFYYFLDVDTGEEIEIMQWNY